MLFLAQTAKRYGYSGADGLIAYIQSQWAPTPTEFTWTYFDW
jgi:hypothetical protein